MKNGNQHKLPPPKPATVRAFLCMRLVLYSDDWRNLAPGKLEKVMVEVVEQSIEYQRAMDALYAIQENPRFSNLEQRAWKYLDEIVHEVENYYQREVHDMGWDFNWAHTYDTVGYRSCWSPDPEGRDNEGAAWHVSDAGVEFRIILNTHGTNLIEIVGELDGYGACDFCELRYRDDYDGENGVLNLRQLDSISGGVLLSSDCAVSSYVRQCLEDYCGWVAGPIQRI